ncbi:uncharacterized protein LOC129590496 [Paramacrobiotus metropolitanus]|uniref:uncharacterized protein LOC129590496 n=1 Tax=Paramacrobiotus metropolitanus TaxID=2943436 RepID=UPI002445FDC6|nr:uncharacterized protein LOC129590496 [Paramacrobiotus metropolitanus]
MAAGLRPSITDLSDLTTLAMHDENAGKNNDSPGLGDGDQLNITDENKPVVIKNSPNNAKKCRHDEDTDNEDVPQQKRSVKRAQKKSSARGKRKRRTSSSPRPAGRGKKVKDADLLASQDWRADESGITKGMLAEPKVILVVDTNVLLEREGLRFLEDLTDGKYDGPGIPAIQIRVPHVVFLELDRQKNRSGANNLSQRAQTAIRFLHDQLVDHRRLPDSVEPKTGLTSPDGYIPRFVGQTARDFTRAGKEYQQHIDDDHLLFCCLQTQQAITARRNNTESVDTRVWCLTNDRNMRTRSVVNGVAAFSLSAVVTNLHRRRAGGSSIFDSC